MEVNNLKYANGMILTSKLIADGQEFDDLVITIYEQFQANSEAKLIKSDKRGKRPSKAKRHMTFKNIISCLYYEWRISNNKDNRCVRYYRNKKNLVGTGLGLNIILEVIEWLNTNDYIVNYIGGYDRNSSKGKTSRIRWANKLTSAFSKVELPIFRPIYSEDLDTCQINIRDSKKQDIKDDEAVLSVFDALANPNEPSAFSKQALINEIRLKTSLNLNGVPFEIKPLYRVFNNSKFDEGGRFYGCKVQYEPSNTRKLLTMNGNKTIELDYDNLHYKMMYQLIGTDYAGDAYLMPSYGFTKRDRKVIKSASLKMINAKTLTKARKSIQMTLNLENQSSKYDVKSIMTALEKHHSTISDFFGSGFGMKMMNIDSKIALEVMYHFANQGIPCFSIHDSFIVEEQYKTELEQVMKKKYKDVMTFERFIYLVKGRGTEEFEDEVDGKVKIITIAGSPLQPNLDWESHLTSLNNGDFAIEVSMK